MADEWADPAKILLKIATQLALDYGIMNRVAMIGILKDRSKKFWQ
jgi:hypothetical protein